MQHIKEIITNYKGSMATAQAVKDEIARRYGDSEASKYDAYRNCMTYRQWLANQFKVKRGEHAIPSITFIENFNERGEVISVFKKKINLFYYLQVEPITN